MVFSLGQLIEIKLEVACTVFSISIYTKFSFGQDWNWLLRKTSKLLQSKSNSHFFSFSILKVTLCLNNDLLLLRTKRH